MSAVADQVDLNIEFMYQAAKELIPDKADRLAEITKRLGHYLPGLDTQAALAGDPAVLSNLLKVADGTFDALRVGVQSLNNAAEAVLATAKDFARSDDDARRDFKDMDATLDGVPLVSVGGGSAPVPAENGDISQPGAAAPDGPRDGGHPTQGGSTPSTPDPVSPDAAMDDNEDRQHDEEIDHPYASEEV